MTGRFLQRWSRLKQTSSRPSATPPSLPDMPEQAALRRTWLADPVIRDFVEVADNQWDFNDPAALPGFGPLPSTKVADCVAVRVGQPSLAPALWRPAAFDPSIAGHLDAVWLSSASQAPAPPSLPAPRPEARPRSTSHGGAMPKDP